MSGDVGGGGGGQATPRKIPLSDSLLLSLEAVASEDEDADMKYADRWLAAQEEADAVAAAAAAAGVGNPDAAAAASTTTTLMTSSNHRDDFRRTPSEYAQTSTTTSTSSYATSGITSPNDVTSPPSPSSRNAAIYDAEAQSRLFSLTNCFWF